MDVTSRNIAICKVLGLDPAKIRRGGVTITLDGDLGPLVEVRYRTMDESLVNAFEGAVARYRLVPVEDADVEDGE